MKLPKAGVASKILDVRFFGQKKLFATVLSAILGSGYVIYYFKRDPYDLNKSVLNQPLYIYLPTRQNGSSGLNKNSDGLKWLPWRNSEKCLHWQLLKLAKSKNINIRHIAIKALAELPNLNDSEYLEVAQASDLQTAVGLARTLNVDQRFFLQPPSVHTEQMQPVIPANEFRMLLEALPQEDVDECVLHFTKIALETGFNYIDDNSGSSYFGEEGLAITENSHRPRKVPLAAVNKFCLQALLSHSKVPHHRKIMVQKDVLKILFNVYLRHKKDIEVQSIIAQIISNLAIDESLHKTIFMSGWIGILALWLHSPNLQLTLPAGRALINMDKDESSAVFDDSIYPIYPQFRGRTKAIRADIVFVHGLMGGVFKTWRQHDSRKNCNNSGMSTDETNSESQKEKPCNHTIQIVQGSNSEMYTQCWPKDWLSHDCPYLRVLGVDYDTHYSDWKSKCPFSSESHSLKKRGSDLLKQLALSKLGDKPIIWVGHSMGGLLVKQMVLLSANSNCRHLRSIASNTAGFIFYSVPHKGTELANMKSTVEYLLLPSTEVKELKQDSPYLLELHQKFEAFVTEHNLPCLSFGETKKSKLGINWSAVLVPTDSSDPGFGDFYELPYDHLNICKPESRKSTIYRLLLDFLHKHTPYFFLKSFSERSFDAEDMETSVIMGLMQ